MQRLASCPNPLLLFPTFRPPLALGHLTKLGLNACALPCSHLHLLTSSSPPCSQVVTAGANPISVKKGIDKTCEFLVAKLKEVAKPVKGRADIKV